MGLVIFGALAIYLIVLVTVTWLAYRWAVKRGLPRAKCWLAAAAGFLAVYLPVFWDHIPTLIAHKYYCEKEAGFWVYKTVDQWKSENPEVMETLAANKEEPHSSIGNSDSYVDTYFLNQRINIVVKNQGPLFFHRWRYERVLIDTKTNEALVRYVDFSTSQIRRQAGWSGWKFWLDSRHCSGGMDNAINSGNWINQFKGIEK